MVEDKGLDADIADKIWTYAQLKGGKEVVAKLQGIQEVQANESAKLGLEEMALLCSYLEIFDVLPVLSIDMSLARGLDYYTGIIYEVVTEGSAPTASSRDIAKKDKKQKKSADPDEDRSNDPTIGVGSVAAGGRYDELVGMFSGKPIPCVGISFGVDRIFSIIKSHLGADHVVRPTEVDVLVMAFGGGKDFTGLLPERMEVAKTLWDAGIKAEYMWKAKPNLLKQFKAAENAKVPWGVILGEDELRDGKVKIKELGMKLPEGHPERDGVTVEKAKLVEELQTRILGKTILPDRTVT
jgi:histidyl-tRNA synthetase